MVEDSHRVILSDQIDFPRGAANKLAVVRQIFNLERGEIHVFTEYKHAVRRNVGYFTYFRIDK